MKKEYRMSKEDRDFLGNLPNNLPETRLTKKERDKVGQLYRKYISSIDNWDWSPALVDVELSEKWPSGPRLKRHEAERIVLGFLESSPVKMTNKDAAKYFYYSMTNREASIKLISKIYDL